MDLKTRIDKTHIDELLAAQRREEKGARPPARLTLQTKDGRDAGLVRRRLTDALPGVDLHVAPLFDVADEALDRFLVLSLPGVSLGALSSPFDLAYDLRDALGLASVEPQLEAPGGVAHSPVVDVPMDPTSSGSSGGGCEGVPPTDAEWHLKAMRAPEAWGWSRRQGRPAEGAGISIAQVDTGVAEHELVRGVIDWGRGKNLFPPPPTPEDPLNYTGNPGHGLSVAAAAASHGQGADRSVRGTAPRASIVPFRAVNSVIIWPNNSDWVASGIALAVESGAPVLSMSLGGILMPHAVERAIAFAASRDVLMIAAAGNKHIDLTVAYPGRDPRVIGVAGSTPDDKPWDGSCRGGAVAITAPAKHILTPWRGQPSDSKTKVGHGCGTSYAAASVAGIAALWLAHFGRAELLKISGTGKLGRLFRTMLTRTARTPAGWNRSEFGAGIVDAEALLKAAPAMGVAEAAEEPTSRSALEAVQSVAGDLAITALSADERDRYAQEILWRASHASAGAAAPPISRRLAAALQR